VNRQAKAAVRFDCDCGHRLRVSTVQAISTSQLRGTVEDASGLPVRPTSRKLVKKA
jgi:hypothetical protein